MRVRSTVSVRLASASLLCGSVLCIAAACGPPAGETSCTDGVDNDMNGLADCDDAACAAHVACGGGEDGGVSDGGRDPCGPDTCSGCCDGSGRCLSGESLAACGEGGAACEACPIGASCEATGCEGGPVACGPANCDGCCMGDVCVAGDSSGACGGSGGACEVCDEWEVCLETGACGVDPESEWQVSLLDGVLPPQKFDGDDWDPAGAGEADPYVQIIIGSASAGRMNVGEVIDGTLTPDWTMGGTTMALSGPVTAAEILAFIRFDVFEDDVFPNGDDTVGMCEYEGGEEAFNGEVVTLICEPDPILEHAGYTLRWQLLPR